MNNNSKKLLFLSTLMMGTILSISSNSWLGVWMGLEINLLSFIPMLTNNKNMMMNESAIKYFIVQAMASTMLLFSILLIQMKFTMSWEKQLISSMMVWSSLLLKIGAAPFHFWFPEVMSALSWINCLTLMTWQKIAPMMVLSYCIQMSKFIFLVNILSIFIGAMGGLNQTSLKKVLAYSSISHLGWMTSSLIVSENVWELYFLIYSLLSVILILLFKNMNLFMLNQIYSANNMKTEIKFMMFLSLLSLGGLPPFLGFLPKWIVIQLLIENNMTTIMTIMVVLTTITLYYYLRISFSALILSYTENSWSLSIKNEKTMLILPFMVMISTMGLICSSTLISYY
uniref:NADH-ubiquinone oxidoreductase chain 2 n=3 Tax=Chorthippus parallelus TaxID=37639 RepID=A0A8F0WFG3_CHOPA|nr:NADH dehydrogenase subunit 2 [Chorthippus parallelus parallelus]YP_010133589.1 NADH dehydrogenase subunit 2 [Chorthippus parallelus erythropus]QWM92857.1 NADH dehydrogenase subunit 2 [Chorthippus parallelus parallelus]QWM92866.1 NADH dehydrogenase subunit 2 [Chorthippus parallelus parallelus]QWM92879.1 NADH dehydrogenase subunit 2 [Chorthippus parallelus erythropus]QWM92892.1 NADH dehydrogenase subunit 2 [Chorthippus parallelus erythropus]QWM92905.1 NADH dehydrogenase subunit 2 [Chorthippu